MTITLMPTVEELDKQLVEKGFIKNPHILGNNHNFYTYTTEDYTAEIITATKFPVIQCYWIYDTTGDYIAIPFDLVGKMKIVERDLTE